MRVFRPVVRPTFGNLALGIAYVLHRSFPALMQQVLDIPQRKRETDIHYNREADDFRRGLEIAEDRQFHVGQCGLFH